MAGIILDRPNNVNDIFFDADEAPPPSKFSRVVGSVGSGIVTGANIYKGTVDTAAYAGKATIQCAQAAISVVGDTWKRGLTGTLKEVAKSCSGFNELVKAKNELTKAEVRMVKDEDEIFTHSRSISERLGTAIGHSINATLRLGASTLGTLLGSAYVTGSALNALDMEYKSNTLLGLSQLGASGLNGVVSIIAEPMTSCVSTLASLASTVTSLAGRGLAYVALNPSNVTAMAGAGAFLYGAAIEVQNANKSESSVGKVAHTTVAIASTVFACAVARSLV